MFKALKRIVEDNDTRAGRFFDLGIQILIILSLISFSIETLPNLSLFGQKVLWLLEISCVTIFSIEYFFRVLVADSKLKFAFSFYGLIDLFAILPFYLSTGIDLRSIRVFRLLRLFRIFKLFRYSRAINRFRLAFLNIKEELVIFLIATSFLLYISSIGIYYFEHEAQPGQFSSVFHCMWWAVATLTTVGYGDVYPITIGGKVFTFFILMIGLGIVAVPAGLIASALTTVLSEEKK
ncbi:MAG TPA: ion transporter [Planctomycetes bacterium]|nr:ion transporter [Planctomycetota bacterium]